MERGDHVIPEVKPMKKREMLIIIFTFAVLSCLLSGAPAFAQYWDDEVETTAITTSDGTILELSIEEGGWMTRSSNSIGLAGDGFYFSIRYTPDWIEGLSIEINNSDTSWAYGEGIIGLDYMYWYDVPENNRVDMGSIPPEYAELWETCMETCSQLLESDDYWAIIEEEDKANVSTIQEYMRLMADGYCAPSSFDQFLSVSYTVNDFYSEGEYARGYSCDGPVDLYVLTTSPYGTSEPQLIVPLHGADLQTRWVVYIDPDAGLCTLKQPYGRDTVEPTAEEIDEIVNEIRSGLEFYYQLVPHLLEYNALDENDDLDFLLMKALEGLDTWQVEFELSTEE